jgi:glucose/arabinose dehydrogenase
MLALAVSMVIIPGVGLEVDAQTNSASMSDRNLAVRTVVSGLVTPASLAFIGPNEMLVTEKQTGRVRHIQGGIAKTALDLAVNYSAFGFINLSNHASTRLR